MIKIGSFFEEHIEKMILVIVGLICVWLLITRVLLSPNVVSYDDKNFSPISIDNYVYQQAELLRQKLAEPPDKLEPYEPKVGEFLAMFDSAISDIDSKLWLPHPYTVAMDASAAGGVYDLPRIGEVNDVAIEYIRAAAYVPIDVVTPQNPYNKAGNEPNDIDLVTVEGKFDIAGLYDRFKENFMEDVEEQWADPCLAKPVFAAVNLQRQVLNDDGTWGDWQDVPRSRIDHYSKLFEILEDIKDLPPGGLKVQTLQFDDKQVQIDLLQPQAYQFASAKEEWFPPQLYREFLNFQRKETLEQKRDASEAKRQEREKGLSEKRTRRSDTRGIGTRGSAGGAGAYDAFGGADSTGTRKRGSRDRTSSRSGTLGDSSLSTNSRRRSSSGRRTSTDTQDMIYDVGMEDLGTGRRSTRGPSINDVYNKYYALTLTRTTDFAKLREPLVFWAYDDTVEQRRTYRYRIRLGVFNPVAGTNQLSEQYKSRNNEVVLWSDFSDITDTVEIPGRLYFFAKDIQEAAKTITVTVCRYLLGHWYTEDFKVRPGNVIGDVIEPEPEKPERTTSQRITPYAQPAAETSTMPETIDYSTGAIMVDAVPVNDWSGDKMLRTRRYYEMLYSYDGINIEHMPVSPTYWAADMGTMFGSLVKLSREPQEPFKAFGTSGRRQLGGEYDEQMMEENYDEELMYEDMGGMGRY